eukprot:TRINITY_DN187_c1_g2_i1.p1 TRINITY_DN187_c1_g2~~TRINITY_DN187_c1_g2_i1.p1  ORF type:complete len:825 (+),score=410.29 TRINITY_DN187_c1_g2_i1:219-2693(+)
MSAIQEEVIEEESPTIEAEKEDEVDDNANIEQGWQNPIPKSSEEESEEDRLLFFKERECALLLLEARRILASMLQLREKRDEEAWNEKRKLEEELRKKTGNMAVQEIQEVLQLQAEDDESEWLNQIQELKNQISQQMRTNLNLDRDLQLLEKKISLIIKNKANIQNMQIKARSQRSVVSNTTIDQKKLEHLQNLFYLLQVEPRYLAKCISLVSASQMETYFATTVRTLYADALSSREEYLLLKLFQLSIENEMKNVKQVTDFLSNTETVVPKMVSAYNKRKQGAEYVTKNVSPLIKKIVESVDLNIEIGSSVSIYTTHITSEEQKTGQKSSLPPITSEEEASKHPIVIAALEQRSTEIKRICDTLLEAIFNSVNDLPYGLRWICKQFRNVAQKSFPNASNEEILNLEAYFLYVKLLSLGIVQPEDYIQLDNIGQNTRKNLISISRVMQRCFYLSEFTKNDKNFVIFNSWINSNRSKLLRYFDEVARVEEPEDTLQMSRYPDLTQNAKPVIYISFKEIINTIGLLFENEQVLASDKEDPLRKILSDLGRNPFEGLSDDDREIQLTLTNRFASNSYEEENETNLLYNETKELVIQVLRLVPLQSTIQRLTLMEVLETGIKRATETEDRVLSNKINRVLENLGKLEKASFVTKDDNYDSFVHDVALEVANRAAIREQQRKEIIRLKATLEKMINYSNFANSKIENYRSYVQQCMRQLCEPKKKGKKQKESVNFSYKELKKKGVIVQSEVPKFLQGKTNFTISRSEGEGAGLFDVVAKLQASKIEKMQLKLEDLLEKLDNNTTRLELDQITLDISLTIALLNRSFLSK